MSGQGMGWGQGGGSQGTKFCSSLGQGIPLYQSCDPLYESVACYMRKRGSRVSGAAKARG